MQDNELEKYIMNYNTLLDLVTDIGYRLAMAGAETFRVEDSVNRLLSAYDIPSEVFSIPNCLIISIETADGKPLTRMRRIGTHGNDLDAVERYNSLSRRICSEKPDPLTAQKWLQNVDSERVYYSLPMYLLGNFLGASGFAVMFGSTVFDALCAGFCGIIVGIVNHFLNALKVNTFFSTIVSAFLMAISAYSLGAIGIVYNTDTVVIGALMLLVPGLLFTNAMRDIIFGDTNSGTNRIVQVLLVAAAIALGTGAAWSLCDYIWGIPLNPAPLDHTFITHLLACFVGCLGFSYLCNIQGFGKILCTLGGVLSWGAYLLVLKFSNNDILAYFIAAVISAVYSETMARIRKYPAISYLVISIFPTIPGASIYYTTNFLVRGDMTSFAAKGTHTIAIAGVIAVGILTVSTLVRLRTQWIQQRTLKGKKLR